MRLEDMTLDQLMDELIGFGQCSILYLDKDYSSNINSVREEIKRRIK